MQNGYHMKNKIWSPKTITYYLFEPIEALLSFCSHFHERVVWSFWKYRCLDLSSKRWQGGAESPEKTAESKPPNRYHIATLEMKIQTAPCREPETAGLNPVLPTLEAFRWSHAATSSVTGIPLLISLSVTQSMTRSHVAVGCVTQTLDKANDPNA